MKLLYLFIATFLLTVSSYAQDFSGTYTSDQIILTLVKNETGTYAGSLSGNNNSFKLTGQIRNGMLQGKVGEENSSLLFVAGIQNQKLSFTMGELDSSGNLNPATSRELVFVKSGEPVGNNIQNKGEVIINQTVLTKAQIQEIINRYGVEPKQGNYWYDPVSGLYGVVGFPSYGFMYPGLIGWMPRAM